MKWILLTIIFLSSNVYAQKKSSDPIVAKINGKVIRKSALLSYHQQNLNFAQNNRKVTLEESLNDLIDRIIGIDDAKEINIHKRPDVVKKMNDIVYHAYISEELTPKLKKIKISDNDIERYYKQNPEYKTSQILIRLKTLPSPEDVAEAIDLANKIYKDAVKNPKNFSKLAKKYSEASSALTGGDMGYQPRVRLANQYFESINGKKIGYITNPFRTQYGVHVVMVTGKKDFKQIDMNLYKKILHDVERDKILRKYFAQKRNKANLKIYKDRLKYE
ncbi:MAG: peptidylprolyl isomerase [Bacteriovoracaceae bacterium]|jgi:parvulin-like peptidyl-prolyl isomerase|nr:hypothetical protein [Halobacteriovoraceae bacterium]MDP7321954.1 peptidylprolyl isomerase [Bacteriovoracaceae bacterium]